MIMIMMMAVIMMMLVIRPIVAALHARCLPSRVFVSMLLNTMRDTFTLLDKNPLVSMMSGPDGPMAG